MAPLVSFPAQPDVGGMPTLHDKVRAENTHGSDADTRLGGTVGGTQAGEDDGAGATHGAKEGLRDG